MSRLPRLVGVAGLALAVAAVTGSASGESMSTRLVTSSARSSPRIAFLSTPAPPRFARPRDCPLHTLASDLYVVNADGSRLRRFASDVGSTGDPLWPGRGALSWSPDGGRIAYENGAHAEDEIFVVATGDGRRRNLTRNTRYDGVPAWSPDGRRIAFESWRNGAYEIYVMNSDGSGKRRLTRNRVFDGAPAWSPDGRRIAFLRGATRESHPTIYLMDANGRAQRSLNTSTADGRPPAWSPDGKRITFSTGFEVFVVDAEGNRQQNLTNQPGDDVAPAWSPDGRRIAFEHHRGGSSDLYIVNADGSRMRSLARRGRLPAWAPDGRRIAFVGAVGATTDIFVVNADGSQQRNVTHSPAACDSSPAWAPSGKR